MYSSWLLISSCLTNLLNSLNVSQSSGLPDCLALSYLLFFFLISLLMFLFTHGGLWCYEDRALSAVIGASSMREI